MSAAFFFNDTATTETCTLPLHDALPISARAAPYRSGRVPSSSSEAGHDVGQQLVARHGRQRGVDDLHLDRALVARALEDRKSTRLNSSHANISHAVFCLKKKKPKVSGIR